MPGGPAGSDAQSKPRPQRGTRSARAEGAGGRRQAILEAALACFAAYGYTKTTMDDVRVRAGASTGSLYHHFKSKEQLAAELYVEGVRRYQEGLSGELSRHGDARSGVRTVARYHLEWVEAQPDWALYLSQSRYADFVAVTEPAMRDLNREMKRKLAEWARPFIEAGELADLPGDVYQSILIGPAQELARMRLTGRSRTDLSTAMDLICEAACKAVCLRGAKA
jgi:AcrR family transcriptional regulator